MCGYLLGNITSYGMAVFSGDIPGLVSAGNSVLNASEPWVMSNVAGPLTGELTSSFLTPSISFEKKRNLSAIVIHQ